MPHVLGNPVQEVRPQRGGGGGLTVGRRNSEAVVNKQVVPNDQALWDTSEKPVWSIAVPISVS